MLLKRDDGAICIENSAAAAQYLVFHSFYVQVNVANVFDFFGGKEMVQGNGVYLVGACLAWIPVDKGAMMQMLIGGKKFVLVAYCLLDYLHIGQIVGGSGGADKVAIVLGGVNCVYGALYVFGPRNRIVAYPRAQVDDIAMYDAAQYQKSIDATKKDFVIVAVLELRRKWMLDKGDCNVVVIGERAGHIM